MLDRVLVPGRPFFALVLAACAVALAGALAGQYLFGLEPCVLCLYQRVPFVLAGLVAAAMLGLPTSAGLRRLGAGLVLLAFAVNAGIAAYHVGVEQRWWTSAVCEAPVTAGGAALLSVDDLRAALAGPPQRPACDQVAWTLFGVSMAGYNLVFSAALAAFAAAALLRSRRTVR